MEADGHGDRERSSFRCLHVARYVLAAVMTVLVAAITFSTVRLVLYDRSHDPLQLSIVRGTVVVVASGAVARTAGGDLPALLFYQSVQVSSKRGFRYYANISKACLFFDGGRRPPGALKPDERDAIVCLRPNRTIAAVEQQGQSYFLMEAKGTRDTMNSSYFDALYHKEYRNHSSSFYFVWLRLEGAFIVERRSGWKWNTTSPTNIYLCDVLTISDLDGDEVELQDDSDEVFFHDHSTCLAEAAS